MLQTDFLRPDPMPIRLEQTLLFLMYTNARPHLPEISEGTPLYLFLTLVTRVTIDFEFIWSNY